MDHDDTRNSCYDTLDIFFWNICSFSKNKANLFNYLHSLDNKPQFVVLAETWLDEGKLISTPGYNAAHNCLNNGRGGISVLVKKGINYTSFIPKCNVPEKCQFIIVKTQYVTIMAGYIPPDTKISLNQWKLLLTFVENPFILVGDFNAHHQAWGSARTDLKGKILNELSDDLNLINLNDGAPTLLLPPESEQSVIDVAFCSEELASVSRSTTIDDTLGSNHFPILINISNLRPRQSGSTRRPYFKLKSIDWAKFAYLIETNLSSERDVTYESYSDIILDAVDGSIPKHSFIHHKYDPCPWWDEDCSKIIKLRKQYIKEYKRTKAIDAFVNAKKFIAMSKKELNKRKRDHFRSLCTSLNRESSISEVWKSVRRYSRAVFSVPKFNLTDNESSANSFLCALTPDWVPNKDIVYQITGEKISTLNSPISMSELQASIEEAKDTAPGLDGITNPMISNLPPMGLQFLLSLYNGILNGHPVPQGWKHIKIHPILKPGKDPGSHSNYRAISLLSCIRKTFERILKNRLDWWCERSFILDTSQFGFRKSKSTIDCLNILTTFVETAFVKQEFTLCVSLDIVAAYDNVEIPILLKCLNNIKVPGQFLNCISQLFSQKILAVDSNKTSRHSYRGLPQGSILSPLLYNIYMAGLEKHISEHVRCLQYADDIIIFASNKDINILSKEVQIGLNKIITWLNSRGLSISFTKSHSIWFSRRKSAVHFPQMSIFKKNLPNKENIRYLGIWLDQKLKWNYHISLLVNTCYKFINLLKSLCGKKWGADPQTLRILYQSLIRSRIEYGCSLFSACSVSTFSRLERVQYQCLRIILGAMKSSPTNSLQVESSDPPLLLRFSLLTKKQLVKNFQFSNSILIKDISNLSLKLRRTNRKKIPFLVTVFRSVEVFKNVLESSPILDTYRSDFFLRCFSPNIYLHNGFNYSDGVINLINKKFLLYLQENWSNHSLFFTDGSLHQNPRSVSIGIHSPTENLNFSASLNNMTSIYTAELIAIYISIRYIIASDRKYNVVFSDSRSALSAISTKNIRNYNCLVNLIRELLFQAYKSDIRIFLVWIPSHKGIFYNEKADSLAKLGRYRPVYNINLFYRDLIPFFKEKLYEEWNNQWVVTLQVKGMHYGNIQKKIPRVPWFCSFPFSSRAFFCSMIRMRIGHGLFPIHLFRLKLKDSPLCECGEEGSINHLFFNCSLRFNQINSLIQNLIILNLFPPYDISNLLSTLSIKVYKNLYAYLDKNNLFI